MVVENNTYNSIIALKEGIGVNLPSTDLESDAFRWRSDKDKARVESYKKLTNLYRGRHLKNKGGVFKHPYGIKAKVEDIPYIQINMLAKIVRIFCDLVVGGDVLFTSTNPKVEKYLNSLDFSLKLWTAYAQTQYLGFIGFQPIKSEENFIVHQDKTIRFPDGVYDYSIVHPRDLYLEFDQNNILQRIKKMLLYKGVQVGNITIDVLYVEIHTKGLIETKLFRVEGEFILQELDLMFFTQYINEDFVLQQFRETGLKDFYITVLFNEIVDDEPDTEYTETMIILQEALNKRLTQIDRILTSHSNPKLLAPISALKKDDYTGESRFIHYQDEVLFKRDNDNNAYGYLTWNGNLAEAVADRNNKIVSMLNEADISPQHTSFSELVSGTVADTASKVKQLASSTTKKSTRKRKQLRKALDSLINNLLTLMNIKVKNYSYLFEEIVPSDSRKEEVEEVIVRQQNGLISDTKAIQKLDGVTEEEARQEVKNITEQPVKKLFP